MRVTIELTEIILILGFNTAMDRSWRTVLMTREGPIVFVCRISERSEAVMVQGGVVVWQMAAALTTMSIFPLERTTDRMACTMNSN